MLKVMESNLLSSQSRMTKYSFNHFTLNLFYLIKEKKYDSNFIVPLF